MRVAVIVPCFNDGSVLTDAVASLRGAGEPLELVVVDDGSTDPATAEVLAGLAADGVTVLHQANTGLPGARMAGLAATAAPYVFPLDADDLAEPGALTAMADALDAAPEAAVCWGDYVEFGGPREIVRATPPRMDAYRLTYTNEYPVTALFRRTALERVGGWRAIHWGYEDWDLWMGLVEQGYDGVHAGPGLVTYRRRLHGERMLTTAKRNHRTIYRTLRGRHPALFADVRAHRRTSDLSPLRKALYPFVYGGRPRFRWESSAKALLDRAGVWTQRR
ncbi:MAG: polysaccharide deacetylase family protein [Solirubrobacteraceae bacterium]|nr:polysaccharide deacetylase family protein [Solirubrobacteraceae bacterium]